jgi:hypothetical protein
VWLTPRTRQVSRPAPGPVILPRGVTVVRLTARTPEATPVPARGGTTPRNGTEASWWTCRRGRLSRLESWSASSWPSC